MLKFAVALANLAFIVTGGACLAFVCYVAWSLVRSILF